MTTDLTVTGRPAQFGRGVMADVSDILIGRFADCLSQKLSAMAAACAALWRLESVSTWCAFAAVCSVILLGWTGRRPAEQFV
ncbi:DUF6629 family protein [Streptomyces sp. R-74717]|uniref:DUF6629 family protein n=1 Tax=Streptomyces sp. R-74717 TaxID=2969820 RepID=UPI0039B39653